MRHSRRGKKGVHLGRRARGIGWDEGSVQSPSKNTRTIMLRLKPANNLKGEHISCERLPFSPILGTVRNLLETKKVEAQCKPCLGSKGSMGELARNLDEHDPPREESKSVHTVVA